MKIRFIMAALSFIVVCSDVIAQKIDLTNKWTYSFNAKDAKDAKEAVSKPSEKEMPWVEKDSMLRKTGLVYFKRTVVIPSSLKQQMNTTGVVALYLGRI